MMPTLDRQRALLRFIHGYQLAHDGISPTMQECADATGTASKSSVFRMLDALEQRKHIVRTRGRHRAIKVLRPPAIPMIGDVPLFAVPIRLDGR